MSLNNYNTQLFSAFEFEDFEEQNKIWKKRISFYMGDFTNFSESIDFVSDWRFCSVENKRKIAIFLGTTNSNFPIIFPITLNNGFIINSKN